MMRRIISWLRNLIRAPVLEKLIVSNYEKLVQSEIQNKTATAEDDGEVRRL